MHIQGAVDARAKTVAPATLARDFSALRAVFNAAVDADLIGRSPARRIALPRSHPPRRVAVNPEELERLASQMPPRFQALVLVAGVLGLRWGEVAGLRVRDVDFLRRTVTVAQVIEETAGHLAVVSEAKTPAGLRTLSAPAFYPGVRQLRPRARPSPGARRSRAAHELGAVAGESIDDEPAALAVPAPT